MSNRNARNIKSSGQSFFRKQAEKINEVLAYTARANVQFGEKPFMRMEVYGDSVAVTRKQRRI